MLWGEVDGRTHMERSRRRGVMWAQTQKWWHITQRQNLKRNAVLCVWSSSDSWLPLLPVGEVQPVRPENSEGSTGRTQTFINELTSKKSYQWHMYRERGWETITLRTPRDIYIQYQNDRSSSINKKPCRSLKRQCGVIYMLIIEEGFFFSWPGWQWLWQVVADSLMMTLDY